LQASGWDAAGIEQFSRAFNELRGRRLPKPDLASRAKELLGLRRELVLRTHEDWVRVPLFRFGAPDVPKAVVEYTESDATAVMGGWQVKIGPVGVGRATELTVGLNCKFPAENGAYKEVSVSVKVRATEIAIYEGVRKVGEGWRAEVALPKTRGTFAIRSRACTVIDADTCKQWLDLDSAEPLQYALAEDRSGDIVTGELFTQRDVANEVSLQLERLVQLKLPARVKSIRRIGCAYKLPAGHDYHGHLGPGALWWAPVPRSINSKLRRMA
jgi:hypothetical protein